MESPHTAMLRNSQLTTWRYVDYPQSKMADDLNFCCWKSIHELSTCSSFCGFLKALEVWIERPHVLNRRLMGALILKKFSMPVSEHLDLESLSLGAKLLDPVSTRCVPKTRDETKLNLSKINDGLDEDEEKSHVIILRKLLPRQLDRKDPMFELVIVDTKQREVVFVPLSTNSSVEDNDICDCQSWLQNSQRKKNSYRLLFKTHGNEKVARIVLQVLGIVDIDGSLRCSDSTRDGVFCPTVQWLQSHLITKLCKWAEEIQSGGLGSKGSLRLVPLDQYTLLYNRLKQDYGEKFVKIWPERTDPHKFVYEDVAIAAYLLVLWKEERDKKGLDKKQSFVDLGCGNGLLVHILSEEGHPGFGVDIRQRNIWSLYGESTRLEEMALDPTAPSLFKDVDWLIGNHSDELTPWIPVMTARASYTSCFFVLPCCLFDFNCKFVRKNNKVTQYRGYLDFVREVGETCGFEVEEDSLRIPSTKRICHIGRLRSYREEDQSERERLINDMIRQRGCNIDERKIAQKTAAAIVKETEEIEKWRVNNETGKHCMEQSCGAIKDGVAESDYHEHNLTQQDQLPENEKSEETYKPEVEDHSVASTGSNDSDLRGSKDHVTPTSTTRVDFKGSSYDVSGFQPRPYKEPVRNCASLEKSLKELIVDTVARTLLGMPLVGDGAARTVTASASAFQGATNDGYCNSKWRKGGSLQLSQVAGLFDKEILAQLKNECGGLQTLLRNHYYVFRVQGGTVQMRDWTKESRGPRIKKADSARRERRSQALWKTSMCWFHTHHPDGCPVSAEKCPFAHSDGELRERPTLEYLNSL